MKSPDRLRLKYIPPKFSLLVSSSQEQGDRPTQEDILLVDQNQECFALADGLGGQPYGEIAAAVACESIIWNYNLSKHKRIYLNEKRKLAKRLFRTAHLAVLYEQKKKKEYELMATTLLVVLLSEWNVYVFHVGDSRAYLFRNGKGTWMNALDRDDMGRITKVIGIGEKPPEPSFFSIPVVPGDKVFFASDGVMDWVSEYEINDVLLSTEETQKSLDESNAKLLGLATIAGSTDNRTSVILSFPDARKNTPLLFGM